MKVLALYDIHGNPDALDAVLADPAAAGADAVVIGGDAVPGCFTAETLARIDALEVPVHAIRGNGEREVATVAGGADLGDLGATRFVNAGSVGLPYEGDGAARWLLVSGGEPELRATAYDHVRAGERMLAAGWPDERSVQAALVEPLPAATITEIFEERARG